MTEVGGKMGKHAIKDIRRILVVEDDISLKPFWTHVISSYSDTLVVEWAVSGETAIETLRSSRRSPPFDIVILDIFLSGTLTGLDVLNEIKNSTWGTACEVVLSSVCDIHDLKKYLIPMDTDAKILTKPYEVSKCLNTVVSALSRLEQRAQEATL
jgi:DNA-binding response OmpR family regulator